MKELRLLLFFIFISVFSFAQTLRIAVYQYADNPRIKNLEPLADHLQKELRIETSVKSYPNVHALIKGMQDNEVDLAFISTFGYLLLQAGAKHPMFPLAALISPDAKDNYKTAIVTRKSSSVLKVEDLIHQGSKTKMAFVAKGSTSGNLVPRLMLKGLGINDPEKHFASVKYSGTHARAIEWVVSDSTDVAAMGHSEWEKLDSTMKNNLRLLWLSSEIPLGPVLINKNFDKKTSDQISQLLLKLHQTDPKALNGIKDAWTEAKQATHFISISQDYYLPYLKQFGKPAEVETIIREFVN